MNITKKYTSTGQQLVLVHTTERHQDVGGTICGRYDRMAERCVTPRLGASLLSAQYVHKTASLLLCFHEAQKREIRPGHIGTRDTARSDDDFIRPP